MLHQVRHSAGKNVEGDGKDKIDKAVQVTQDGLDKNQLAENHEFEAKQKELRWNQGLAFVRRLCGDADQQTASLARQMLGNWYINGIDAFEVPTTD